MILSILAALVLTITACRPDPEDPWVIVQEAEFMLHDAEGPGVSGDLGRELGINTIPVYLDVWSQQEAVDDQFYWANSFAGNIADYGHCIVRIGILHVLAWNPPEAIPDWLGTNDPTESEFQDEYAEYVQAAVGHVVALGIEPDLYLVELEGNYAGHELPTGNMSNSWIIDWINWEVGLIRAVDPDARICLPLTASDLMPGEVSSSPTDLEKLNATDFIDDAIAAGVQFDAIAFGAACGVYQDIADSSVLGTYLDEWRTRGKEVFLWILGYPADNADDLFRYPRAGGYSQTWQSEQYVETLTMLLDDTNVLGVQIGLFDYQEGGAPAPYHWGLVTGTSLSADPHTKRPAFEAVREYWHANYR
jgi:hypothetical protein